MEKIISPSLREEIQIKADKIRENPDVYEARQRRVRDELTSIGDSYSFWIENPKLRKAYLLANKQKKTLMKQARAGIRAVTDGWYFLLDKGRAGNFLQVFTPYDLERLNAIVYRSKMSPVAKPEPGKRFRRGNVTINVLGYNPPNAREVPEKIRELLGKVKRTYKEDPLEAAILTHLGIASIQPFDDGNKRCARLVQSRILFDCGLPPAVIPAGEGKFYMGLFTKSVIPFRDGNTKSQRGFYDYCASKVNNALDEILDDLHVHRQF